MMEQNLTVRGIVLSSMPVGEYDRRLSILTGERGKISAFARGARRPRSQLLAASNPFAFGEFEVYQGRDSYTVHRADIDTYFTDVTGDIDAVWYGYLFLEMAEYFAVENADEGRRLILVYMALRALAQKKMPADLVCLAYEFKTLVLNGEFPDVFRCTVCGRKEGLSYYSRERRGCVCEDCRNKAGGVPLSASALYTLQFIAATEAGKLFSFKLTDEVMDEVRTITSDYYKRYVGHAFKSRDYLDMP